MRSEALRALILLVCAGCCASLWPSIAAADDVLAQVAQRLHSAEVIRGDFEQTLHVPALSRPLQSRGDFIVARDQGLIWQTRQPVAATVVLTADGIRQRAGVTATARASTDAPAPWREQEVPPGFAAVSRLLLGLFSGDLAVLRHYFTVAEANLADDGWRLELAPRQAALASQMQGISLSGDALVRAVTMREPGGVRTEIRFLQVSHQQPLTEQERDVLVP